MERINTDFPKFRKRIQGFEKKEKSRADFLKKIDVSDKTYRNWINGKNDGGGNIIYSMPSASNLKTISEAYGVSIDWLLGLSDFTSPENDFIGKYTGLNDTAIQGLQSLLLSDQNAVNNQQPGLSVLPVLNMLLGSGIDTERLLNAVRDYFNPGYNVPVYHDGTGNINSQGVLSPACIIPNNIYDKMGAAYLLHLAKSENAPDDNITVPISEDFLKAVALKQIEQALIELKNNTK